MTRRDVAGPWGVRVLNARCPTCIFRPGNLMELRPGRLAGMLTECERDEGYIPCHETIHTKGVDPAICRGFAESGIAHRSLALRFGHTMNCIIEVDPPEAPCRIT